MSMTLLSNPDLANNLHYKPLSAHLARGIVFSATWMQKGASATEWHGRVVVILSKALVATSAILSLPLMLIESLASIAFALIGIAINKFCYENKNEFLQKYTCKFMAFSLHSLGISASLIGLSLLAIDKMKYHIPIGLADNALHIGSAALVQCTYGASLDIAAGRDRNLAIFRTILLLKDSHPNLLNDMLIQLERDSGEIVSVLRERLTETPQLQQYLERHPDDRPFIEEFEFTRLLNDRDYRRQAAQIVQRYFVDMRAAIPAGDNGLVEIAGRNQNESAYQTYLADTLKDAFLEIYRRPNLYGCLDAGDQTGQDLLGLMDASTFTPLTTYTAYQEVLAEENHCPETFTGNLAQYNDRNAKIQEAKRLLAPLGDDARNELVQKILRGSDFNTTNDAVQQVYLKISELAAPLYQGPLMTRTYFNFHAEEFGQFTETRNLFQRACQDAIAESVV